MVYEAAAPWAYGEGLGMSTCYSFSIWWCGEASQELEVQRADVSALPSVLPHSSKSPASCQSPWITEVRRSVTVFQMPSLISNSLNFSAHKENKYLEILKQKLVLNLFHLR
jgi:hypothetical protein